MDWSGSPKIKYDKKSKRYAYIDLLNKNNLKEILRKNFLNKKVLYIHLGKSIFLAAD